MEKDNYAVLKTGSLTVEEAIGKGYTKFVIADSEEGIMSLTNSDDLECAKGKDCYVMEMDSPLSYTISAETIAELISEYVSGQEEMVDEDEKLFNIAKEQDYSILASELNAKFAKHIYYEPSHGLII